MKNLLYSLAGNIIYPRMLATERPRSLASLSSPDETPRSKPNQERTSLNAFCQLRNVSPVDMKEMEIDLDRMVLEKEINTRGTYPKRQFLTTDLESILTEVQARYS